MVQICFSYEIKNIVFQSSLHWTKYTLVVLQYKYRNRILPPFVVKSCPLQSPWLKLNDCGKTTPTVGNWSLQFKLRFTGLDWRPSTWTRNWQEGCQNYNISDVKKACKYCRIQQIQLLNREMRGVEHDRLWNQLEAEIHLHRHKTVIRACRGRGRTKSLNMPDGHVSFYWKVFKIPIKSIWLIYFEDVNALRRQKGVGDVRKVMLHKESKEGLGISITVRMILLLIRLINFG